MSDEAKGKTDKAPEITGKQESGAALGGKPDQGAGTTTGTPTTAGGVNTATVAESPAKPATTTQEVAEGLQARGVIAGAGNAASVAVAEAQRGSGEAKHTGEEPENAPTKNDQGPIGDQLKPASFVPSGSLPAQQVPSPTGLIPAPLVGDADIAQKLVDQRDGEARTGGRQRGHRHLDEAKINTMNKAELRAVAYDRGYDIGESGTRVTRARFAQAQAEDDLVEQPEK